MKKLLITLLLSLLLLANAPASIAQSNTLAHRIQNIMDRPEFRHALFGIEFYSLDTGKPIYTFNADKLFTPGSTTKLLTEGRAVGLLGADYRCRTRVYRTGPVDSEGTLDGDLVLVASGDPNLSGRINLDNTLAFENEDHSYDGDPNTRAVPGDPLLVIRRLAQQVADQKIQKIRGRVIVDISLFREGARELGTGVVMSPIVVNDNIVDVTIGPGAAEGAPVIFKQSPATSYVTFVNRAITATADSEPEIRWTGDTRNPDGTHRVTISGNFPAGKPAILFKYSVPEPSRFAETVLLEALREKGITIEGGTLGEPRDFARLAA